MEKYRDYTAIDFLSDEDFLRWLTNPTQKDNDSWNGFLKTHPYKKADIREATLVFRLFHSNEEKLGMNETYDLWNRIQHEARTSRRAIVMNMVQYAAILILVFFSGAIAYYFYQQPGREYQLQLTEIPDSGKGKAMIILSDGSRVSLEKQTSQISYSKNGQRLVVNNDTLIQKQGPQQDLMNKVIIPYGKKSMIELSDGTKVWLNAGSKLIYPSVFDEKIRQVVLVGEAFFDVSKNPKRPFVVRTTDMSVQVLGTRFDISAYPEDKIIQTVLEEGKVNLKYEGRGILNRDYSVEMKPNQMVELNRTNGTARTQVVDVSKYVSWKEGMLEFDKIDLIRALKQVERYYNINIILADPLIGSYKLSGKLDLKDEPEKVLNVIKLTVPIDWQRKSNGDFIIINKQP